MFFLIHYRYAHEVYRLAVNIKENIINFWNRSISLINETVSEYPLLAYGTSVCRKIYRVGKALVEHYSVESNLRQLLRKFVGNYI